MDEVNIFSQRAPRFPAHDGVIDIGTLFHEDVYAAFYYAYNMEECDGAVPLHCHIDFELFSVEQGVVQLQVNEKIMTLREHEGVFINSKVIHRFEAIGTQPCRIAGLHFSSRYVNGGNMRLYNRYMEGIVNSAAFDCILLSGKESAPVLRRLQTIISDFLENKDGSDLFARSRFAEAWYYLWKLCEKDSAGGDHRIPARRSRTMVMLQYMDRHISDRIRLADLARAASVSVPEVIRCFQETFQTSPMQYLYSFRMKDASRRLRETSCTIQEIARQVGYSSPSYFTRDFRREFGVTPSQYRQRINNSQGSDCSIF